MIKNSTLLKTSTSMKQSTFIPKISKLSTAINLHRNFFINLESGYKTEMQSLMIHILHIVKRYYSEFFPCPFCAIKHLSQVYVILGSIDFLFLFFCSIIKIIKFMIIIFIRAKKKSIHDFWNILYIKELINFNI